MNVVNWPILVDTALLVCNDCFRTSVRLIASVYAALPNNQDRPGKFKMRSGLF